MAARPLDLPLDLRLMAAWICRRSGGVFIVALGGTGNNFGRPAIAHHKKRLWLYAWPEFDGPLLRDIGPCLLNADVLGFPALPSILVAQFSSC